MVSDGKSVLYVEWGCADGFFIKKKKSTYIYIYFITFYYEKLSNLYKSKENTKMPVYLSFHFDNITICQFFSPIPRFLKPILITLGDR